MKRYMAVVLIALSMAGNAQAQLSDAQVVARLRQRPQATRERSCENKPVHVVMMTVLGAVAGWMGFMTVGLGLFADDHGSVYQRDRRYFMIGGALVGAGVGLYQVATNDCVVTPRR